MKKALKLRAMALFAATLAVTPFANSAQAEYPEKPVELVIPFRAGGSTETIARVFAKKLGEALGGIVVPKTRPGGGGAVGSTEVARAEADGYTLLFTSALVQLYAPLVAPVDFKSSDFTFISQISNFQHAIVAKADAPFDTLEEMIAISRNKRLAYADQGSITRHIINYLAAKEGVEWTAIPTKGGGEMVPFLLGGKVDFAYSGGIHARYADDMKVIASLKETPLIAFPEIPSIADKYGVSMPGALVVAAPAGVPDDIIAKLDAAVAKAVESQEMSELLTNMSFPVNYMGTVDLNAVLTESEAGLVELAKSLKK